MGTPAPWTTRWPEPITPGPGVVTTPGKCKGGCKCKRWNDWSSCGKSCLRCRCCADAPDYNPPLPHLQRECERCSGDKCKTGGGNMRSTERPTFEKNSQIIPQKSFEGVTKLKF